MRRRLSWAVLGTSGVLAVVVATMMTTQSEEQPQSTKIIVPQAGDLEVDLPQTGKTHPSTVFIADIPPVAVTSETVVPATPSGVPSQPAVAAPKAATSAAPVKPALPVKPPIKVTPALPTPDARESSFWDIYSFYWNSRYPSGGSVYQNSYDSRYDDRNRDGDRYGDRGGR